jgi:flagellar basal-body rod protein FlgF
MAYTRDGRMQMLPSGDIVSLGGHAIVDASGSPLTADPRGGTLDIGRDGVIRQDGRTVGSVGMFAVDLTKGYRRFENAAFLPSAPPEAIDDFSSNGIVQGFTEGSNVNPILEMTRLIEVQRAFEAVSTSLEQRDSAIRDTIQALGARGS